MKTLQECKEQAAKQWFWESSGIVGDYRTLSNGVKCGNIKQRNLESVLDEAAELYASQFQPPVEEGEKQEGLSFEDYCKLIGAGPLNEPAFTIYRTFEHHGYKIVKSVKEVSKEGEKEGINWKEQCKQHEHTRLRMLTEQVQLEKRIQALQEENERLKEDNERLRVQLAGCGVAAMSNTKETFDRANQIKKGDYGWSASYGDCLAAAKREIELIEENGKLAISKTDYDLLKDQIKELEETLKESDKTRMCHTDHEVLLLKRIQVLEEALRECRNAASGFSFSVTRDIIIIADKALTGSQV